MSARRSPTTRVLSTAAMQLGFGFVEPDPVLLAEFDRVLNLDPPPRARASDPETSHEAAAKVEAFAGSHYLRIYEALELPGTCKEIAARCGLDHVQVARRLPEMQAMVPPAAEPTDEKRGGCRVWKRGAKPA